MGECRVGKCNFCIYQTPGGYCGSSSGSGGNCQEAVKLYAQYMMSQSKHNNTKNVNVNKSYKKGR